MTYTRKQRRQIMLRAKRKLGQMKQGDPQSHFDFMRQCIDDMMQSGECDNVDDARDECTLLWEEDQGIWDE